MDGFHLDNAILEPRGLLPRKGAPDTFDTAGFCTLVERLLEGGDIPVPLFDRALDRVLPDATQIDATQKHVIVEGNYLFLDHPPWTRLSPVWSLKVFLATPLPVLEKRLIERWLNHGLSLSEAMEKASMNDLVNSRTVLYHSDTDRATVLSYEP